MGAIPGMYHPDLAKRIKHIESSLTTSLYETMMQMKLQGIEILNCGVGEPDFYTPDPVKEAGIKAIQSDFSRYTANRGMPELLTAIGQYFKEFYNLDLSNDHLIASNGAKQSIFLAIQTLFNPGDKVLLPVPYYPSYLQMLRYAEAVPQLLMTQPGNDYALVPDDFARVDFSAIKGIILNYPANPTGKVIDLEMIHYLAKIIHQHNLVLITDDIYRHLSLSDHPFYSLISLYPELLAQSVIISGVSKSSAMTGWRLGFAASSAQIVKAMDILQNQVSGHPSSISQVAAIQALKDIPAFSFTMSEEYRRRKERFISKAAFLEGIRCIEPDGALYVYLDIAAKLQNGPLMNSLDYARYLLERYHVAVTPGEAFGQNHHLRITLNMTELQMNTLCNALTDRIIL